MGLGFLFFLSFVDHILSDCIPIFFAPGMVDITKTLRNCSEHMVDPLLPSSYSNSESNFTVSSQIVLNNLILVDEIAGLVKLDFIYRVSWIDPRWKIPEMWQYIKPEIAREGITITDLVRSSNPLELWLSDNTFYDETESTVLVEAIRFKPEGSMYWTRHFVMTIAQPGFDYAKYPLDSQQIVIRISPYTYSTAFVRMAWGEPAVLYVRAKPDSTPNLMLNQIWSHKYGDYSTEVYVAETPTTVNGVVIPRSFDFSFLNVTITRKEKGIVIRLIAPIVVLMILSGVTFWATLSNRLSSTMTILLSVSALYIAVFGQIPMIGYLTSFDHYVLAMYSLLIVNAFVHQFTIRLDVKVVPWPFRVLAIRLIEASGRLFVGPFACGTFMFYFRSSSLIQDNFAAFLCFLIIPFSFLLVREVGGIAKAYDQAMVEIHQKFHPSPFPQNETRNSLTQRRSIDLNGQNDDTNVASSKVSILEKLLYQLYYHTSSNFRAGVANSNGMRSTRQNSVSTGVELSSIEINPTLTYGMNTREE
jgi:hypothetical protein